jgi:hypothetical protein
VPGRAAAPADIAASFGYRDDMPRVLAVVAALLSSACTGPSVEPAPEVITDDSTPAPRAQEAPPTLDDPDQPLALGPGELMRIRGGGGACGDRSIFVMHEDGRFSETSHEGCYMGVPGQGPPPPAVEADRLDWKDLARLHALLADPGLPQMLAIRGDRGGSNHPSRSFFLVRTPAGPVGGEYIGPDFRSVSRFHAFVHELYERLYPCPPGLCDDQEK